MMTSRFSCPNTGAGVKLLRHRLTHLTSPCCFQAKADGIQGNFSGDLLQSGGMLIVAKGTVSIQRGILERLLRVCK